MADDLPQEALVRIFHFLPIKVRSRLACVSQNWRSASIVDAVTVRLKDSHVPHYLHVALPDGAAQQQAAVCPIMSLARSADITWASAATGSLLQSMPSLERLAFTSMNSMSLEAAESGLQRLSSLTNLQSLHLNTNDVGPVLEAMHSSVPATLKELKLHLTGDNWQSSVLDKIATQLGSQASQLRSLALRCSHPSVYAATEAMESLTKLSALSSLRMGPNPEDIFPHSSPLGFPRLPSFLTCLPRLQHIDISMADSATVASLSGLDFAPIRNIPDVKITLRADTSIRTVAHLPASISCITGLSELTVQGFTFEDPGGWCTTAYFDVNILASNPRLRHLDLQLVTWECEHCESFELPSLHRLTQLHSLSICIAAPATGFSGSNGGSSGSNGGSSDGPELLLMLPLLKPARKVTISSSMRVVLRNSKVLARARIPGVLAQGIMLEEPLPQRPSGAPSSSSSSGKAVAGGQHKGADSKGQHDTAAGSSRDQGCSSSSSAAASSSPAAAAGCNDHSQQQQGQDQGGEEPQAVQQYVRAPAHVVVSALRDLWPNMEVWQYNLNLPAARGPLGFEMELCCQGAARDSMQQQLTQTLTSAMARLMDDGDCGDVGQDTNRGFSLW